MSVRVTVLCPLSERLSLGALAGLRAIQNLIDCDAAPDDPIYRLVVPQPDMLPAADVRRLAAPADHEPPGERGRCRGADCCC